MRSELFSRIVTGIILAPLGIAAVLYLNAHYFAIFVALIFACGLHEWTHMIGFNKSSSRLLFIILNMSCMYLLWQKYILSLQLVIWGGALWWLCAIFWLRHHHFASRMQQRYVYLKALLGFFIVISAWSAAVTLHQKTDGGYWVLYVLLLVWCADISAYFAGRRFGHKKLAPHISPGKTYAGVWGALLGCTLYAIIAGYMLHMQHILVWFIGLSLITVILSIIGDLFESLMKRQSHMKDSGHLLPGHGGVLDRFDSLFAALPIFVTGTQLLGL